MADSARNRAGLVAARLPRESIADRQFASCRRAHAAPAAECGRVQRDGSLDSAHRCGRHDDRCAAARFRIGGSPALLAVEGSAHLRSVREMLFDAKARRIDGDGNYELHLRFDAKRMDASLAMHEPAGGPLENILSLPGLGALNATLNLNGPRAAEQLEVSLEAGSLRGHAQGNFNLTELSGDLDFGFTAGEMTPRADLAWRSVAFKGRWRGNLKSPTAEGHLKADRLRIPGEFQAAALSADITADLGKADIARAHFGPENSGAGTRLSRTRSDKNRCFGAPRRFQAAGPIDGLPSAFLVGRRSHTAGKQSAKLIVRAPDLAPSRPCRPKRSRQRHDQCATG